MKQFFSHPLVITIAKILVSVALIAGLIYYIDISSVLHSFRQANPFYISIGFLLAVLQLVVHFYRWRYLLRLISTSISNEEVFTSLFVGTMAGFFTPAQLGEFAGRIASHPNVNKSHVVGITVIDKLYMSAVMFIAGGAGIAVFTAEYFSGYWNPLYRYFITFLFGMIISIFIYPDKVKELLKLLPEKVRNHRFYEMIQVIENVFHNKNAWILSLFTALLYGVLFLEYYFLANAFGPVEFGDVVMCAASVFFVKAFVLPISFGDLGIRESAAVFFFEKTGTTAAMAFNASIVMSFANVIIPTAIGAILVIRLKKQ